MGGLAAGATINDVFDPSAYDPGFEVFRGLQSADDELGVRASGYPFVRKEFAIVKVGWKKLQQLPGPSAPVL